MAEADKSPSTKRRAKRRVRPVESVREQRNKQQNETKTKPRRIGKLFHWLGWPFRWVASWKLWRHPLLKPVRFVAKIIGYILFIPYIRGSWRELRQVTWPNWKQSWRLTWAVLVFSVFFGGIVAVVDYGLDKMFKQLILNL